MAVRVPHPVTIVKMTFHPVFVEGRCEAMTARKTRCRALATMAVKHFPGGKDTESRHNCCETHRNTRRWW